MDKPGETENPPKPQQDKKGMARLWELALREKALILCSCVLAVLSVVVSFAPFIAIYYIIRELVAHFADLSALDAAYMTDLGWLAAESAIGAILLNFLALMCSHLAAFKTQYELKLEYAGHIASLPLGFHSANSTGKLRKIVDENIEKLEGFVAHSLPDMVGSFAMPVITLVVLFVFDWRLGLASLVPIIAAYGIQMAAMGGGKVKAQMKQYQDSLEDMNSAAVEYVRGISVVKAFNQTLFSFRRFHQTITDYGRFCKAYTDSFEKHMSAFMTIIGHVYAFLIPVIILIAGGTDDYAQFALAAVFYLLFSFSLATPFTKIMYVSSLSIQISDGIERMDRILAVEPLPETKNPKTASGYEIAFEEVAFSYNDEGETSALNGVSFTALQGQVTALVGPSGSGKSTIAHLIPRFYDVAGGTITIDGVDIRDMASDYLMSIVGFVFQDVFLFKQSIADNILIGNKNASREQAVAAAKAAQCHEFIEKLPQGYDTIIGSSGVHLSGGEQQRIVIARAILKNAPILVLDEATAFADPENEQKIHLALSELMKDKTVIIIAHRLSTVRGADKVLVVDRGKIVEEGTHDALVSAEGRYGRMWAQYTGALGWTLGRGHTEGIAAGGVPAGKIPTDKVPTEQAPWDKNREVSADVRN
ncbi:MAG: ABC transporter ATP-binding protein/permease [Coriobacteriales bacterium]|jgi:ATP-binding cassette subfamily B protein|nr:ABC transporter ATP-binding protein/permease [Coriobacteriales bacterium]